MNGESKDNLLESPCVDWICLPLLRYECMCCSSAGMMTFGSKEGERRWMTMPVTGKKY